MNKLTPQRSRPLRLPSEDGGALIIALIVVLALTGIGLVTLAITADATREVRRAHVERQAEVTTEGVMLAMIDLFDNRVIASTMAQMLRTPVPGVGQRELEFRADSVYPGAIGVDGNPTMGEILLPRADGVGDVHRNMVVTVRRGWPPRAVAGFEVGDFCRERFEVTGRLTAATVADWETERQRGDRLAAREFRAIAMTPPIPCEGYQ